MNLSQGNRIIVGTLLEDGEPLAAGVGIIDVSGRGTFQVAELRLQPKSEALHEISDLYGNRWPVGELSADGALALDQHYNFTHAIRLPDLLW
jgi:hypothetical protein